MHDSSKLSNTETLSTNRAIQNTWSTVWALSWREWTRFIRQPNRVIGAVGQPLLFWILFGTGFGPSFQMPVGTNATGSAIDSVAAQVPKLTYFEYYFPGTLVLILLFTAIFATISIIEDRREGFLQSVLVAPGPRWGMVLGKILGGTMIAVAQATLFLLLALTVGIPLTLVSFVLSILMLTIIAVALTSLGFILAWRLDSTQGFHAIMSVVLLPMWLLSGAFFPADNNWIGWIVRVNPMTYCVAGMRRVLYFQASEAQRAAAISDALPSAWLCGLVTMLFLFATLFMAWYSAAKRTAGDLL